MEASALRGVPSVGLFSFLLPPVQFVVHISPVLDSSGTSLTIQSDSGFVYIGLFG